MSTPPIDLDSGWRVGDRVRIHDQGRYVASRISSVHRRRDGVEYVVRTDGDDGTTRGVVNLWSSTGLCSYLHADTDGRQ